MATLFCDFFFMNRISSNLTFFYKKILPLLWVGVILFYIKTFFPALKGADGEVKIMLLFFPVAYLGIGFLLMKFLIFDAVDEVYDCGDHLLVKNRGQEDKVFLRDIRNINYNSISNPARVTLSLRQASRFGEKVVFIPAYLIPAFFIRNEMVENLILRVDSYRK